MLYVTNTKLLMPLLDMTFSVEKNLFVTLSCVVIAGRVGARVLIAASGTCPMNISAGLPERALKTEIGGAKAIIR